MIERRRVVMVRVNILSGWLMAVLFVLNGALCAAETPSIIQAVKDRDLAGMRALIKAKVDVNAPQADGATALHWSVHRDDIDSTKLLIKAISREWIATHPMDGDN